MSPPRLPPAGPLKSPISKGRCLIIVNMIGGASTTSYVLDYDAFRERLKRCVHPCSAAPRPEATYRVDRLDGRGTPSPRPPDSPRPRRRACPPPRAHDGRRARTRSLSRGEPPRWHRATIRYLSVYERAIPRRVREIKKMSRVSRSTTVARPMARTL